MKIFEDLDILQWLVLNLFWNILLRKHFVFYIYYWTLHSKIPWH